MAIYSFGFENLLPQKPLQHRKKTPFRQLFHKPAEPQLTNANQFTEAINKEDASKAESLQDYGNKKKEEVTSGTCMTFTRTTCSLSQVFFDTIKLFLQLLLSGPTGGEFNLLYFYFFALWFLKH